MKRLAFQPVNSSTCRVLAHDGVHMGNLKLIDAVWKFKAIGYDELGQIVPGGGPLTEKHNTVFAVLDEAQIDAVLRVDEG